MSRKLLIDIHMYLAAFLSAPLLLMAISGGLYLLDQKGTTEDTVLLESSEQRIDIENASNADIQALLASLGVEHSFEYLRKSGNQLFTRPTSKTYYVVKQNPRMLTVTKSEPDLVKVMVELHKGHGPGLFRDFQKLLALGLVLIVVSGLWMGLQSRALRNKSALTFAAGIIVFVVLAAL